MNCVCLCCVVLCCETFKNVWLYAGKRLNLYWYNNLKMSGNVYKSEVLPCGTMLQGGKYVITEKLGQGGFGITYLGKHVELESKVAIKEFFFKQFCERDIITSSVTVPTEGNRGLVEAFRRKFVKEARTINKLSHRSIVHVSDVFSENGTSYYVMDYINGNSLSSVLAERGAMSEADAIKVIDQVADALSYVHSRRINHLDIKPANIMIENVTGRIVLIDFGVSKLYDSETGEATTSTPVGRTDGYSPLEQYEDGGVNSFSPQSDIYALGATLYKMITGITPPSALRLSGGGKMDWSGVSSSMVRVIQASMQQEKNKRPATVAEFQKLLHYDEPTLINNLEDDETEVEVIVIDRGENENYNTAGYCGNDLISENNNGDEKKKNWQFWLIAAVVAVVTFGTVTYIQCYESTLTNVFEETSEEDSISPMIQQFSTTNLHDDKLNYNLPNIEMVYVSGGTFDMGATSEQGKDAYIDEKPEHSVKVDNYYIGKYEVSQELWKAVMGNNPSYFKGDDLPVENVSWDDVQIFIRKLNLITGKNYRLPTEAEWEFAARGGNKSRGYKYSGSNIIGRVAWYDVNSDNKTHEVGTKSPNELGIYDMSGNVLEWCQDWYDNNYYNNSPEVNPKGPSKGSVQVRRGGCWNYYARLCRVSNRRHITPGDGGNYLGFRLAHSDDK